MAKFILLVLLTLASSAAVWSKETGNTIIVGGFVNDGAAYSAKADLISDGKIIPLHDLPMGIAGAGVIIVRDKVIVCSSSTEDRKYQKQCFSLDLKRPLSPWRFDVTLPLYADSIPFIASSAHIWILSFNEITSVYLPHRSSITYDLPDGFDVSFYSCGGGNNTHKFVIPQNSRDIWMNTTPQYPNKWTKKSDVLGKIVRYRACMIRDNNIYVTGGEDSSYLADAERVDLDTYEAHKLADMSHARSFHGMGIINDKVAVIGGQGSDEKYIGSIEVYDAADDEWTTLPMTLSAGKVSQIGYAYY